MCICVFVHTCLHANGEEEEGELLSPGYTLDIPLGIVFIARNLDILRRASGMCEVKGCSTKH